MRRIIATTFFIAFFVSVPVISQTPPQFMAAFGGGSVKGKSIGKYVFMKNPSNVNADEDLFFSGNEIANTVSHGVAKRTSVRFTKYSINYKIYSLFSEPVFDFQFLWEKPTEIYVSEKFGKSNSTGFSPPVQIAAFPSDLQTKIAKLRPISVRFMITLSNKSYYSALSFSSINNVAKYTAVKDLASELKSGAYGVLGTNMIPSAWWDLSRSHKIFTIDVAEPAGRWQSFTVPGSPQWKELPPYFKKVFKDRKNPDDLFVADVALLEIQWPEYEIESIVSEYLNRKVDEQRKEKMKDAAFWDAPVGADELPVKIAAAPDPTAEKREAARPAAEKEAAERFKNLEAASKNPATIAVPDINKMQLALNPLLGNVELRILDAAGNSISRVNVPAGGKPVDLAAVQGVSRIEVYRSGELVGSIPWSFMDVAKGLVELSAPKGPYSVRVSLNGIDVFSADCRNEPQKHVFALPAGYSPEKLPELLVTTSGFGSYVTGINRNLIAEEKRKQEEAREEARRNKNKSKTWSYSFGPRKSSYRCVAATIKFGKTVFSGGLSYQTSGAGEQNFSDFSKAKISLSK